MRKHDFIEKLQEVTGLTEQQATMANEVLERHGLVGKKSKEETVADLAETLNVDQAKADEIFNLAHDVLGSALKDKILHPFGSNN